MLHLGRYMLVSLALLYLGNMSLNDSWRAPHLLFVALWNGSHGPTCYLLLLSLLLNVQLKP